MFKCPEAMMEIYHDVADNTLTVYVRREMDATEKILVKMKGKEVLEKNLNL